METQTAGRRINSQQTATLDTITTVKRSESQVCSNGINSQLQYLLMHHWCKYDANMGDDQPIYLPGYSQTNRAGMERCSSVETKSTDHNQIFGPTGVMHPQEPIPMALPRTDTELRTAKQVHICNSQCMSSEMKSAVVSLIKSSRTANLHWRDNYTTSDIYSNTKDWNTFREDRG